MVPATQYAALACQLVPRKVKRQAIRPGQLTLHADRGSLMTGDLLSNLLMRLGITQTHSRPRISDHSPFSEALF